MAVGPFANTWERAEAVDYLPPLAIDSTQIVVAQAPPESDLLGFMGPFPPTMWGAIGLTWVGVSLMLVITMGVLLGAKLKVIGVGFVNALFDQWGILVQQGMPYL